MQYLEIQGERIPVLGFGSWKIKGPHAKDIVKNALDIGYRLIDTAQIYGNEAAIGDALHEAKVPREEVFLITKVWGTNLAYRDVLETVKRSLQNLRTDYIDALLIHRPNRNVPLQETFKAMSMLKREGKVRHIGVSNFSVKLLARAQATVPSQILVNQVPYHPFLSQDSLLDYCQTHDILLMAYSPLAHGTVLNNEVLQIIGQKYGKSPAQIALKWLIQQENVIAIPKAAKQRHQATNFQVFDFQLSTEEMQMISNLSEGRPLSNLLWKFTHLSQHVPRGFKQVTDALFLSFSTSLSKLWTNP